MTSEIVNPFWLKGMIRDPQQLFDREREKERLKLYLTKGISCQIVGPPSIGKSSLLYNVQNFAHDWDRTTKVAYLDLQDEDCRTAIGVYTKAAEAWGISQSSTKHETFSEIIRAQLNRGFHMPLCKAEY